MQLLKVNESKSRMHTSSDSTLPVGVSQVRFLNAPQVELTFSCGQDNLTQLRYYNKRILYVEKGYSITFSAHPTLQPPPLIGQPDTFSIFNDQLHHIIKTILRPPHKITNHTQMHFFRETFYE